MNNLPPILSEIDQEERSELQPDGGSLPTHLIILVNGFIGKPKNWKYAAQQFVEKFSHNVIVHCSTSNSSFSMFNGIAVMGERLAKEIIFSAGKMKWLNHGFPFFNWYTFPSSQARRVGGEGIWSWVQIWSASKFRNVLFTSDLRVISIINQHPGLLKISFIGHSVGGLIARYAIGWLYGRDRTGNLLESEECCGDEFDRKIAGLKPINFVTTATPHLGLRAHNQVPLFCGLKMVEKVAYLASGLLGKTGRNLFLRDGKNGELPLLLQMTTDEKLQFLSALRSFRRRVAYINTCGDIFVGRCTAAMRRPSELPKNQHFSRNFRYPHIVHIERTEVNGLEHSVNVEFEKIEMEEKMIIGLTQLSWELIDVKFNGIKRFAFAHSTMQVKNLSINSDGADVILHITDNFHI